MSKEMNNEVVKIKEESKKIAKQDAIKVVGIISVGILSGIFGYKVGKLAKSVEVLTTTNKTLSREVNVLNAAASEGLYEEAIATVTRKINYFKDQIAYCTKNLNLNPTDLDNQKALGKYRNKLDVLLDRKASFLEAQKLYEISEK